jgi:hypothetical protein
MNTSFSSDAPTQNQIDTLPKKQSPLLRLHTICPYFTMFPLDFPFYTLTSARPNDWILDPFCGRGTTNYAARLRGLNSVGVDSSPVAAAISTAKFVETTPAEIIRLCKTILDNDQEPDHIPEGRFWELCYHPETLHDICKLRDILMGECTTDEAVALRALMLGILHGPSTKSQPSYLSNQMPRTYCCKPDYSVRYWERHGLFPKKIDVLDVVSRKAEYSFGTLPARTRGGIIRGDSRTTLPSISGDGFNWVITSPPYYQMKTYVQDQWLRNWFLGGEDTVNYTVTGQLTHSSRQDFARDLAEVWKNITGACAPGARMVVRLGALPSSACNPGEILQESMDHANCGWERVKIESAGTAKRGRRQSDQFGGTMGTAHEEIDYFAVLT